ncbi:SpaA isopeptide-forming pilin-related protein [Listeria swaminathanii]|uniref:SpaA isopeptide-forming pilin-related protein n=1 Tax=Listeria swaminathanii TaxID=2713501 RepID=A0ABU2IFH9_9LIST|nr:SpaA isopeptide-forming pilin-related protein [Listeria swaminathanii]MDT0017531.1 SpaA isopeptide-forming pilin-related protein [Listeria swaminathanii]MDT0022620.1 SpaA isopeptide-forming pilin-related protein [Listeria swaminathanii]MDT0033584.1 SpaA isopeptide-forming pilin-related protein [Listeria swaminathanii]MDT0052464.1 SpaA isopeptide-forming pilin-related protein [Listeria swaminathanii]MDT0055229.1 SpaA isopeptide-forming pilin-related protein [Listeria swaminathanii]
MRKKLIGSFFILLVLLIIGSTSEKVQASPTSPNGWQLKWAIKNSDFEDVDIADYGQNAGTTNVWMVNQDGVDAWGTTNPTGNIEVWQNGNGYNVPAFSGNNFIELNSDGIGPVYQDIRTIPGSNLTWKFSHRGRNGIDTADLLIGSPESQAEVVRVSDGETWGSFEGNYTVPAGQTITRLTFNPISTANGSLTSGNFLDDVQLYINVNGAKIGDVVWYDFNGDGIQQDSEEPAPGVKVDLLTKDGVLKQSTTTNNIGSYLFTDVLPGDYQVKFTIPDNNFIFSKANQGNNPAINSKPDKTGIAKVNVPNLKSENFDIDAGITTNGKVEIQKLSGDKALSGAVYTIKDNSQSEVAKITTNQNGTGTAEGLPPGNYTATEVTAPLGYQKNTTPKKFTITYGDTNPVKLTFQNTEKMGAINIFKQDESNKTGLANAVFEVKATDGTTLKKGTTNNSGYALVGNLLPGTYVITEIAAPSGYEKSTKEIRVTIPFNPQATINVTFSDKKIIVPPKPSPANGSTSVKLIDKAADTKALPQTGDSSDSVTIFTGLLTIIASALFMYRRY